MERTESTQEVLDVFETGLLVREMPETHKIGKRRIGFFTGDEHHQVPLEEGIQYTKNYRKSSQRFGPSSAYFGREIVEKILDQAKCVGIRIYYAKQASGTPTLVLTGAETNNADQFRGILGIEHQSFASWVPSPNELNSDSWKKTAPANGAKEIFTGNENQFVTLAEGAQLIRNYQDWIESGDIKGAFFGSGIFRKILAQDACVGIHMYHAMHDDGGHSFVLSGVDAYGFDLLTGVIAQRAIQCPWVCDFMSPFNIKR